MVLRTEKAGTSSRKFRYQQSEFGRRWKGSSYQPAADASVRGLEARRVGKVMELQMSAF